LTRCDRQHNAEYLLALLGTLGSLRGFDDEALRFLGAGPADNLHPFPGLEIFIVLEEVLDLLEGDLGQISIRLDPIVPGGDMARRYADDFLVLPRIVLHEQNADRAHAHDRAGKNRPGVRDEHVTRIAVARERVRNEAIVPRIAHRGVEKAIDHQRTSSLVHFIFDRLAPDRHLDDYVHVVGRVLANRDRVYTHDSLVS